MKEVLIEFLDIVINQILYLRGLYPVQIFKKQKAYGLPVYGSLYPPLNSYIKSVLQEALSLMSSDNLTKFELRIHKEEKVYEKYCIDINIGAYKPCGEIEDEFRSSIHALENRCKPFKRLSKDCRFKLLLHTKSFDFTDEVRSQDFLWIKDTNESSEEGEIVPVSFKSSNHLLKFSVERFS